MSFFHKKNVTKCLGHHYAIWTSDSNFLLAQKKISGRPKAGLHFKHCIPLFSIFSLAAILVGSRDHRTQFWKGAIQGPFHQSLVAIGPVVSEEKIKM
jgi:hypothetical protein